MHMKPAFGHDEPHDGPMTDWPMAQNDNAGFFTYRPLGMTNMINLFGRAPTKVNHVHHAFGPEVGT
jgi:hypothetical protein